MAKKANKTANNHVAAGLTTVTDAVSDVASTGKEKSVPLVNMVRRVVLAGVEAAALTTDEVQDFLNRLVGAAAGRGARKLMNDVVTRRDGAEACRKERRVSIQRGRGTDREDASV